MDYSTNTSEGKGRFRHATLKYANIAAAGVFALSMGAATASSITVPNGDFSLAANNGSIGGGLVGGSGSGPIGAGPWGGNYLGALALLAPPTLTIGSGKASVNGLLSINVAGLINNGAYFQQQMATTWQAEKRYTLRATLDTGATLTLGALSSGNGGIALANGGTRLAASTSSSNVSLDLISGTAYQLTLVYQSGTAVSGNIGIQLFNEPTGVLSANLLNGLAFDDIQLDVRAINQIPGSIGSANGSGSRDAVVAMPIMPTLGVRVLDQNGDPIEGLSVNYSVPMSGASAVLASSTAVTGADGIASVDATANTVAGSYQIAVSVAGLPAPVLFDVTNRAGAPASVLIADGSGGGGGGGSGNQSAVVNTPFALPLSVAVQDAYANPVAGVGVTFAAPANGASAQLAPPAATTGSNGQASSIATANGAIGAYAVTATVNGVATSAVFQLTNLLDTSVTPEPIGGGDQVGEVAAHHSCALMTRVTDVNGGPLAGLEVEFVAPAQGASAMLWHGVDSGLALRVATDEDGYAWVEAEANALEGQFKVTAHLLYSMAAPMEFWLTNLAANDPVYNNGFDGLCVPAQGRLQLADGDGY
ncbi:MAG: Ig-like domain-containing protein [Dokdonella sp.]